jgi:hypothetical protein
MSRNSVGADRLSPCPAASANRLQCKQLLAESRRSAYGRSRPIADIRHAKLLHNARMQSEAQAAIAPFRSGSTWTFPEAKPVSVSLKDRV